MNKGSKEQIIDIISSLGYQVFKNGSFHFYSKNTPDMLINKDGTIHCWTTSPFNGYKNNHGDLISFLQLHFDIGYLEAKKEAYRLLNLSLLPPSQCNRDSPKYSFTYANKSYSFIDKTYIAEFLRQSQLYKNRFDELLNLTLPSLSCKEQRNIALEYQIGYIKQSDRLCLPINDVDGNTITLWKYSPQPKVFIDHDGKNIKLPKVLFSKGRKRGIFCLENLIRHNKNETLYLCAGEKDVLNMVGNGFKAITLGSENVLVKQEELKYFADLKVVVAYDYDKAGFLGAKNIIAQLKSHTRSISQWNWDYRAVRHNIKLFKGFDMTNFLTEINNKKTFLF